MSIVNVKDDTGTTIAIYTTPEITGPYADEFVAEITDREKMSEDCLITDEEARELFRLLTRGNSKFELRVK